MNERIHFFIKMSLTLYSRKGDVSCVWEVSWRRAQTAKLTQFLLTIAALLILAVLLNRGSLRTQSPPSAVGSHFGILSPTYSNCLGHLVILLSHVHLLLLFFRLFTPVHLLIDGSVEGPYITIALTLKLHFRIFQTIS